MATIQEQSPPRKYLWPQRVLGGLPRLVFFFPGLAFIWETWNTYKFKTSFPFEKRKWGIYWKQRYCLVACNSKGRKTSCYLHWTTWPGLLASHYIWSKEKFSSLRSAFFSGLFCLSLVCRDPGRSGRGQDSHRPLSLMESLAWAKAKGPSLAELLSPGTGLTRMARLIPKIMSFSLRGVLLTCLLRQNSWTLSSTHTHTKLRTDKWSPLSPEWLRFGFEQEGKFLFGRKLVYELLNCLGISAPWKIRIDRGDFFFTVFQSFFPLIITRKRLPFYKVKLGMHLVFMSDC